VLSRHLQVPPETRGVQIFSSWEALLKALPEAQKPVFFAGGEEIFRRALALPSLERLYLSWVMAEVEGDTYFPPIPEEWEVYRWEVFMPGPGVSKPFILAEYWRGG
jgi:dihydrofolate reductase